MTNLFVSLLRIWTPTVVYSLSLSIYIYITQYSINSSTACASSIYIMQTNYWDYFNNNNEL